MAKRNPVHEGKIQKERIHEMDGPVISFDVSKGESHMRAYEACGKPFGKVAKVRHDSEGYSQIRELYQSLRKKASSEPSVVCEYTGVYALPLLAFFVQENYRIYQISPLESAKMRKAEARPTKNDSLDTGTIAKVYYSKQMNPFSPQGATYDDFREMSRQYQYEVDMSVIEMNRYRRCLDAVWPLFDEIIDYSSENSLDVVSHYGHPSAIRSAKGILSVLGKKKPGRFGTREELAEKIFAYSKTHNSGAANDSYLVDETKEMAERVKESIRRRERMLERMVELASSMPEFTTVQTIPAVADISAVRLLSEIGDIKRFSSSSAFIAYIGLDPMVLQSGKQTGEHLHITKKGNAWLRTTLYLIVGNMCRCSPDSKVAKFVAKKKSDGLCCKAARVAGSAKLARIIYSMLRNGTSYSEE